MYIIFLLKTIPLGKQFLKRNAFWLNSNWTTETFNQVLSNHYSRAHAYMKTLG